MDNRQSFNKNYTPTSQLIEMLRNRQLAIKDSEHAKHCLETVSYYRLSGYFKPFQFNKDDTHQFKPGTTFAQIWRIYVFDRELRLILSDALERIEIALRTSLSNILSEKYGRLWYLSAEPFSKGWFKQNKKTQKSPYAYFKKEIDSVCRDQNEEFIRHYFTKYNDPPYPPSWMMLECLSFGKCTSLFRYLAKAADKRAISQVFNFHPRVIESCLEPLRYTRNLCAHHSRIWNRWFVFTPKHVRAFGNIPTKQFSLHEQILMISKLHYEISPLSNWKGRLYDLFCRYEELVPFRLMGFSEPWSTDPFWDA